MDQGSLGGAVHSGRLLKPVVPGADPAAGREVEWVRPHSKFGAKARVWPAWRKHVHTLAWMLL